MPQAKRSTQFLVAERAGVSIASVSRVLNGLPASPELAERVRRAADELGYVPDASARTLKTGRTDQIVFAVADVGNPVYVRMMHEVAGVVAKAGYRLVLSSTGNDPQEQIDLLVSLGRGYADGLLFSPIRVTEPLVAQLRASRLPIVVIGSRLPDDLELDNIRADSVAGIGLAVEHLALQGRRHIAFVNGPLDTVPGSSRLAGYSSAINRLGLTTSADLQVTASDFTYAAGRKAARRLLNQASPDGIVCANDLLGVAVLKELAARGIRVPEGVAVVGMDNSEAAEIASPSLTSVDLRSAKRARTAAKLLLRRLDDPSAPVKRLVMEPKLSIRQSSMVVAGKSEVSG